MKILLGILIGAGVVFAGTVYAQVKTYHIYPSGSSEDGAIHKYYDDESYVVCYRTSATGIYGIDVALSCLKNI